MWSWLSSFMMNPLMAVGSVAVASPILIHLLSKRRFRRVSWAAMDFLLEAMRRNRRRVRLEQLILLLIRCLAVLLLALVITRPFISAAGLGGLGSLIGRTERILLLDDSMSMSYQDRTDPANPTVFDRAKKAIAHMAAGLSEDSPADSLTLFTTSEPRKPVIALPSLAQDDVRKLSDALATLNPTLATAHMADALSAIDDLVRRGSAQANQALYVFSDFQRGDWGLRADDVPASPAQQAPNQSFESLFKDQPSLRMFLVNCAGEAAPHNLAVTSLTASQPIVVAGVPARFRLRVSNYSSAPIANLEISVRAGQQTLAPVVLSNIPPGQSLEEPLEVAFPSSGSDAIEVRLSGNASSLDGLAPDDQRWTPVDVAEGINVLIVNGEPSNDSFRDEANLIRTALRPAGRAASGNEITVIEEQEIEGMDLASFHAVFLTNVGRVSTGARRNLEDFVRKGGGLVIFLGDQVDVTAYNTELFNESRGLLPMAISEMREAPADNPFSFADWDASHVIMRPFVEELASAMRKVRVFSMMPGAQPAASQPAASAPSDGASAPRIIASWSDGSPAIGEKQFGLGRCVLITTSADLEWNDWASNVCFLPMMLELTQYVARRSNLAAEAVVLSPLVWSIDPSTFRPPARLRTPSYPLDPEFDLQPDAGGDKLRFEQTSRIGLYGLELVSSDGQIKRHVAAVNCDPVESDLSRATEIELQAALANVKPRYIRDVAELGASGVSRLELWWPLLLVTVGLLLVEQTLAWYFGTRS